MTKYALRDITAQPIVQEHHTYALKAHIVATMHKLLHLALAGLDMCANKDQQYLIPLITYKDLYALQGIGVLLLKQVGRQPELVL